MTLGLCRVCQQSAMSDRSTLCRDCFVALYPAADARSADTQHARSVARSARAYEDARAADEADAPPKRRGPA